MPIAHNACVDSNDLGAVGRRPLPSKPVLPDVAAARRRGPADVVEARWRQLAPAWQWRRERQEILRPGLGYPGIVHLIEVARAERTLRQLYPYTSHFALLRYALSFDDAPPRTVDIHAATGADDGLMNSQWARNTSDNVNVTSTRHEVAAPGVHRLKFWTVDPTVVLQRLVIDTGGLGPTYLGPPESHRVD